MTTTDAHSFLSGRNAWVTGAASGMGRATALALAAAGARVAVGSPTDADAALLAEGETADLLTMAELTELEAELSREGRPALAGRLDVASDSSVDGFLAAIERRLGPVDILVNAAYAGAKAKVAGHDDRLWHRLFEINVHGAYRTIRRCLPGMIERGWGRIVNIGSTAATVGAADSAAYCASKAGLLGLTRCVALEGAPHGVSCNMISPGWVKSRQSRLAYERQIALHGLAKTVEEFLEEAAQAIPQRRLLEPGEIGALAVFLCREEALGITMEDIRVSAGSLW